MKRRLQRAVELYLTLRHAEDLWEGPISLPARKGEPYRYRERHDVMIHRERLERDLRGYFNLMHERGLR